jgi:hypothetical protein
MRHEAWRRVESVYVDGTGTSAGLAEYIVAVAKKAKKLIRNASCSSSCE